MRVAIIGGGFSGSVALVNLVQDAQSPLTIDWFEPHEPGEGVAYSTREPRHLLNVRAERMGALSHQPLHFLNWLTSSAGLAARNRLWPGEPVTADTYVPRVVYGAYLHYLVSEALDLAHRKDVTVNLWRARVTDLVARAGKRFVVKGARDDVLADAVILATGHLPVRRATAVSENVIDDFWDVNAQSQIRAALQKLKPDDEVLLMGTGLTAIDVIQTLRSTGFTGRITAVSRHGLFPNVQFHTTPFPAWEWVSNPARAPGTALSLLNGLRKKVRAAQAEGHSWQTVVESLRHVTPALWANLDTRERNKFWRRLSTFWSVHRHRMAPEVGREVQEAITSGKLRILASHTTDIDTALVINCTGASFDVSGVKSGLLRRLVDGELIEPHPNGGLALSSDGSAKGRMPGRIFPMGNLCVGEFLEITAVSEIREQAHDIAQRVLRLGRLPDFESN